MALVLAVVLEAAALRRQRADEVRVRDVGFLEVAPEEGAPAALEVLLVPFLFLPSYFPPLAGGDGIGGRETCGPPSL